MLTDIFGASHSCSFDHRRRPETSLAELARRHRAESRRTSELEVELSERRRSRIVVVTTQAINGRPVTVQKRRAFTVA